MEFTKPGHTPYGLDMELRPRQLQAQTIPFGLVNAQRDKTLTDPVTLPASELQRSLAMGLGLFARSLPSQEVIEERQRMAREIHDTLAQEFAGIVLHLEAAGAVADAQRQNLSDYVARAKELARRGLEDARRMVLGLRPKALEGAHLRDALKQLADNFSRDCGIDCSFSLRGRTHALPEETEDELYRVAQEALCNVRKHSRARSVSILLTYRQGGVLLAIKDNGQGFVVRKPQAGTGGFGLPGMSDRAQRLGGRLDVTTGPGAGTELKLTVPATGKNSTERNYQ